ncbi:MAG: hypothetical protein KH756_06795 [Firmicutes bacterium]|nr:hypothetical protein [Bacillota bacterium]
MTWTWWMTLLAIFAALVLIGCIPVGVDARYNAEGVFLAAKLGPIRLQLLPQKPKKKKKQQKKPEKAPEKAASQEKKPNPILSGGVDEILQLLDIVLDTLGDLRRKRSGKGRYGLWPGLGRHRRDHAVFRAAFRHKKA